jgi:hypothetical protein
MNEEQIGNRDAVEACLLEILALTRRRSLSRNPSAPDEGL